MFPLDRYRENLREVFRISFERNDLILENDFSELIKQTNKLIRRKEEIKQLNYLR